MATALVTGAGVRVGRAIALGLAQAGYDLVLHAHESREGVEEVAAKVRVLGPKAWTCLADLSEPSGIEALTQAVREASPSLDVLVNSAALYEHLPFAKVSRERLQKLLALNLEAPFFLTQALLHSLRAADEPCVVNITDVAVHHPYRAEDTMAHYLATKGGLEALTRALARELAPKIRVNAVAPGPVLFPEHEKGQSRGVVQRLPLQRPGRSEDVARAVVYLVKYAPYVTGHVLAVDGGQSVV